MDKNYFEDEDNLLEIGPPEIGLPKTKARRGTKKSRNSKSVEAGDDLLEIPELQAAPPSLPVSETAAQKTVADESSSSSDEEESFDESKNIEPAGVEESENPATESPEEITVAEEISNAPPPESSGEPANENVEPPIEEETIESPIEEETVESATEIEEKESPIEDEETAATGENETVESAVSGADETVKPPEDAEVTEENIESVDETAQPADESETTVSSEDDKKVETAEEEEGIERPTIEDERPKDISIEDAPPNDLPEIAPSTAAVPPPAAPQTAAQTARGSGLAYGAAITLFGAVIVMLVLGWLADRLFGSSPWGIVIGILVGAAIGFYQFFKINSQIFKK